ncbi:Uncharacterized protein TCM_011509 [Theobroma cacao]|uniref:Uncharacterized protein n=1 Tax=Theobroma cacao TaxID=3641 RepID=A0A061EHC4_THECC|nr:Uncharacterized protein TCM_011509 [Theobroma cacao]
MVHIRQLSLIQGQKSSLQYGIWLYCIDPMPLINMQFFGHCCSALWLLFYSYLVKLNLRGLFLIYLCGGYLFVTYYHYFFQVSKLTIDSLFCFSPLSKLLSILGLYLYST